MTRNALIEPRRSAPIDLLRGVAITLVMLLHYSLTYRLSTSPLADVFGRSAVRAVVNNGNYGVTMFYWSLSVEEMFYLAFPLLCVLARRRALVVAMCLAAIAIGPLYRSAHADDELFFMYGYAACFDAIAFGCLAALAVPALRLAPAAARGVSMAAALVLAAVYLSGITGHEVFGFSAIAACSALLVVMAGASPGAGWADVRAFAPLRWAGRHSYELYLFHIVVLAAMRNLVPRNQLGYGWKLPWLALFIAASALVAALVARRLTDPVNAALRGRLTRRRAQQGA